MPMTNISVTKNNIYSEEELLGVDMRWGQWKFSLSDEEINIKLASLPSSSSALTKDSEHWANLFSILKEKSSTQDLNNVIETPASAEVEADSFMEHSPLPEAQEKETIERNVDENIIEDVSECIIELCNKLPSLLKSDSKSRPGQEEMKRITDDLEKLSEESLILVMENAWNQLSTDPHKICFCMLFTSNREMCQKLCSHVLLPWFSKGAPSKLEELSAVLSADGDTVCCHLVKPLLQREDSPLVQDLLILEELMTSMAERHWTVLLREYLSGLRELEKWHVPVVAAIMEHAGPSFDDLCIVVQLMSSTGASFCSSRDYGALLVAATKCLKPGYGSLVAQLKSITDNYKGPLKFKALKILSDFKN